MTCCQTGIASKTFDTTVARRDLRRYRRRGPDAATREMLSAVSAGELPPSATLLDVGGGIGVLHHVLLERGFSHATQVDASQSYLAVAEAEAERLGHAGRVTYRFGDFAGVADSVEAADVVTLNRVVCCDRDGPRLLETAAARARHLVAFSYPRPRWFVRAVMAGINATRRLMRDSFRVYVHAPSVLAASVERNGLRRVWSGGTWIWAVEAYERTG